MARKRIALRQFEIVGEWHEAVADLVHHYRQCDWSFDAYGCSPVDLMRAAREHARECDGKTQRRAEPVHREPGMAPGFIPPIWAEQIKSALETSLTYRGTDA